MKVILSQEIKGRGGEGDVVEVKRGYAVNYLFPKKLAIEATSGNLKQLDLRKHNISKRETERLDSAEKIQAALGNKTLVIAARVGEEGQLFGSVTTQQIADKLKEELGLEIDRKKIEQRIAIKTAGEHKVTIALYRDVKAVLTINVVDEKAKDEVAKKVEEILEESEEAVKAIANELAAASDALDEEVSAATEALAESVVEVLSETESVIDAAADAAIEDALGEK